MKKAIGLLLLASLLVALSCYFQTGNNNNTKPTEVVSVPEVETSGPIVVEATFSATIGNSSSKNYARPTNSVAQAVIH